MEEKDIQSVIVKVISDFMKTGTASGQTTNASAASSQTGGLRVLKRSVADTDANKLKSDINNNVYITDMFTVEESPRLGCGLMELDNTDFPWTLNYDEMDVVLEGTLVIKNPDGSTVEAKQGEVIFIPKGSSIVFSTPFYTKFLYIVYPADWQSQ
ncbi:cupin domain-containing protein [Brachyspira pilosicoli]|uniref:cupin domain-containing protein n=1 Tax=Brachyspira pilosicoli TaxID=52584 RepID=UPI003005C190